MLDQIDEPFDEGNDFVAPKEEAIWLLRLKEEFRKRPKIEVNNEALEILRWIDDPIDQEESQEALARSGIGLFTVVGKDSAQTSGLLNQILGRKRSATGFPKDFDKGARGLKMWSNPPLNKERSVFQVPMMLEGFDPICTEKDTKTHDRFIALVTLISSQIMMVSEGNATGLAEKEAFLDQ